MNRTVRFDTDQPFLVQQGKEGLAWAGDNKLGHKGKSVAHGETRRFKTILGFVVGAPHAHNQIEWLLGSSFDDVAQGFGYFPALRRCHGLIIALRAPARKRFGKEDWILPL